MFHWSTVQPVGEVCKERGDAYTKDPSLRAMLLAKKLGEKETASLAGVSCAHPYAQPVYALYVEGGLNVEILVLRRSVSLCIACFLSEHNV